MKTCLLCGAESHNDQATCPNDGEASWSEPVAEPEASSDDVTKPKTRAPRRGSK